MFLWIMPLLLHLALINLLMYNHYEITIEAAQSNFDYFGGGGFLQPQGKTMTSEIFSIFTENIHCGKKSGDFEKINSSIRKSGSNQRRLDEVGPLLMKLIGNDLSLADFYS